MIHTLCGISDSANLVYIKFSFPAFPFTAFQRGPTAEHPDASAVHFLGIILSG